MRPFVIGTAGHVDHGKTTLIERMTGIHTDRLPEEKARGISIDLGFAPIDLPGGLRGAVIDVPGHERFIHNMLAGVSGIDMVLLVVAADEGVMPQTREHLAILDLLGVGVGALVITKTDLVDPDWLALVEEEIREEVDPFLLRGAPVRRVSAVTGEGVEELRQELAAMAQRTRPRSVEGPPRLPIDRAFSVAGFGTVVTGTLRSGHLVEEMRLSLLPSGRRVRVRGLEVHGEKRREALAGERVAVNLGGVDRGEVGRGAVLMPEEILLPSTRVALRLRLLPSAAPLKHNARVHVHAGTAETVGRIVLLEGEELEPGGETLARLALEAPLVLAQGDRLILRSYSPVTTIGGGTVLLPGGRVRRFRDEDLTLLRQLERGEGESVVRALLRSAPLDEPSLRMRTGLPPADLAALLTRLQEGGEVVRLGERYLEREALAELLRQVEEAVASHLTRRPYQTGMTREELRQAVLPAEDPRFLSMLLDRLEAAGRVILRGPKVSRPGHAPCRTEAQDAAVVRLLLAAAEAGTSPLAIGVAEALLDLPQAPELLSILLEEGSLLRIPGDLLLHPQVLEDIRQRVSTALQEKGRLSVADLREVLGTSRKFAVPLGEYLDEIRVTRRSGDERVAFAGGHTHG